MDINGIQKVAVAATPWLAVAVAGLLVLWLVLRRSVTTLFEEAPVWKLQRVTLAMLGFVAVVAVSETGKAKFRVSPKINSARLSAETVDAGTPLDGLGAQTVTFANGLSGWTEFQMNAIIPCTVRKADHRWAWKVSQIDGAAVTEFDCATTGPHRVYVVLDRPVEPACL